MRHQFLRAAAGNGGGAAYDPDAQAYITAVEAADTQSLDVGVKDAYNDFVVGCKADGIWDAIKAACIMAGARTRAGALVPLKGTAPTENGTAGGWNYNRETGLLGNATDNYLNSNRAQDADPQNNAHIAVWQTAAAAMAGDVFATSIGVVRTTGGTSVKHIAEGFGTNGALKIYRVNDVDGVADKATSNANGLQAVTRSQSTTTTYRVNGISGTPPGALTSVAPGSFGIFVFAQNSEGTVVQYSNVRLSFYSIGESIDLALLDARVTTLMADIAAAI